MEEIWKDIEGYEGLYQVSNLGKVRSCDRYVRSVSKSGKVYRRRLNGLILQDYQSDGYHMIDIQKYNIRESFLVHRLVAKAFVDNPDNKPAVNHIDRNKDNNSYNNLEWVTNQENSQHAKLTGHDFGKAWRGKHMTHDQRLNLSKCSTKKMPVKCIETDQTFESIKSAADTYNVTSETIRYSIRNSKPIKNKQYTFIRL